MPYWLLTSTTYGTWLPGDQRGSVTSVRDVRPGEAPTRTRHEHSVYGDAFEPSNQGLRASAKDLLKSAPVWLSVDQAETAVQQFRTTCRCRGWKLVAVAVMANHFHIVIGTGDATGGRKLLNDLKAYASRALNERSGKPKPARWWTRNGSHRRLLDQQALSAATNYVLHRQAKPLAKWPSQ